MSWVKENCVSFFQLFCIKVVKTGRVPQHIAFIMDGNRRYAKKNSVNSNAGHVKGFDKLSETLKWCLDLGIPEVTVYAFSIENFKRSEEEVNGLMDLARDKFKRLLEELDQINEWGVRVHVAGRLSLLPDDLRALTSRAMLATKDNNKLRLNIAYAYTEFKPIAEGDIKIVISLSSRAVLGHYTFAVLPACSFPLEFKPIAEGDIKIVISLSSRAVLGHYGIGRDEISRATSKIIDGVDDNDLTSEDIDEDLISATLDLGEPELLVRTSGEVRLSDFMLWQISKSNTVLYFTDVLWPEFNIWNLLAAIIHFQRHNPTIAEKQPFSERKQTFLEKLERRRWQELEKYVV